MAKILMTLALSTFSGCMMLFAAQWNGFTDEKWYSGPKIEPNEDLKGKVVVVECWGINCGPCIASLPHMQEIWQKYKSKPFMLIGSHCQGPDSTRIKQMIADKKLTYPIYQWVGLQGAPGSAGIPFAYVVDTRGKVIWHGNPYSKRGELVEVINEALKSIGRPPSLTGGVKLKYFKVFKKNLELGQNISTAKKRLQEGAKNPKADIAEEAKALLAAIEESKESIKADIIELKKTDPKEAEKLAKLYKKTFPK